MRLDGTTPDGDRRRPRTGRRQARDAHPRRGARRVPAGVGREAPQRAPGDQHRRRRALLRAAGHRADDAGATPARRASWPSIASSAAAPSATRARSSSPTSSRRTSASDDAVVIVHGIDYDHDGAYGNVLDRSDLDRSLPGRDHGPGALRADRPGPAVVHLERPDQDRTGAPALGQGHLLRGLAAAGAHRDRGAVLPRRPRGGRSDPPVGRLTAVAVAVVTIAAAAVAVDPPDPLVDARGSARRDRAAAAPLRARGPDEARAHPRQRPRAAPSTCT